MVCWCALTARCISARDSSCAASRHQIVGEAAGVEEVDITRAVQVPVKRRIDKIAVSVCMWADKRLEHRASGWGRFGGS